MPQAILLQLAVPHELNEAQLDVDGEQCRPFRNRCKDQAQLEIARRPPPHRRGDFDVLGVGISGEQQAEVWVPGIAREMMRLATFHSEVGMNQRDLLGGPLQEGSGKAHLHRRGE